MSVPLFCQNIYPDMHTPVLFFFFPIIEYEYEFEPKLNPLII